MVDDAFSSFLAPNPPKAEDPAGVVLVEGVVVIAGAGGLKDPNSEPPAGVEVPDELSAGFGAPNREGMVGADD